MNEIIVTLLGGALVACPRGGAFGSGTVVGTNPVTQTVVAPGHALLQVLSGSDAAISAESSN